MYHHVYFTGTVEGYCLGLAAGNMVIELRIGGAVVSTDCNTGDAHTGWNSPSRFIVKEIRQGQVIDAGKSLSERIEEFQMSHLTHNKVKYKNEMKIIDKALTINVPCHICCNTVT